MIKSQNISSAGDHRSVLHDFCTEAIVGWTASPFSATMSPKHLAQHCRALEAVSEQFDSLSLTSDSSLVGSTEATCNHVATDIKRLVRYVRSLLSTEPVCINSIERLPATEKPRSGTMGSVAERKPPELTQLMQLLSSRFRAKMLLSTFSCAS